MAATSQSSEADSIDSIQPDYSGTKPGRVFREAIVNNNAICTRCFARQRSLAVAAVPVRTVEDNGDHLAMTQISEPEAGDSQVLMRSSEALDTIELVYPPRLSNPSAEQATKDVPASWKRACPEPTVVCVECGAVDDDAGRSTLSKSDLVEYAKSVSRRLQEQDVEHDPALLVAVTKEMKSREGIQAKDDLILKHATRTAVEKRRYGRSRGMKIDTDTASVEVADASETSWIHAH